MAFHYSKMSRQQTLYILGIDPFTHSILVPSRYGVYRIGANRK